MSLVKEIQITNSQGTTTTQAIGALAENIDYDNTTSEMTATDVQGAIDELKSDISTFSSTLEDLSDVDLNNLQNGQVIKYNSQSEKWENGNLDISGKADKVSSATSGHFAGLDENGNLTDSGKSASDFAGTGTATTAASGLMSSADKTKLDGLGTASTKDVPTSGNASSTEVVMGNDSRLTDARNAADVYSWAKAATKPAYTATEVGAISTAVKGAASGVAELDSSGKVPSSQLPSYVDDVIEGYYNTTNNKFYKESTYTTEITGEAGKIYVSLDTNKSYRWSGSAFVFIASSLALGESSADAYRGDRGKTAYEHSQSTHARTDATKVEASSTNGNIKINGAETTVYTHPGTGTNPHGTTKSDVGLGNVTNYNQSKAFNGVSRNGTTWTFTGLDGTTTTIAQQDNNTWNANAVNTAGYVSAPTTSNANKVWKTDGSGNPDWRDDANSWRGIQDNLTSDSTTDSLSAKQGKNLANGSARDSTKLPLAGGSLTGKVTFNNVSNAIAYQGTKASYDMIKFKDNTNDAYGNGIVIGGGGVTIVGGGEAADSVAATHTSGGDEVLDLASDGNVIVWTNVQDGATGANVKKFTFGTDGVLATPNGVSGLTKAQVTGALGYTPPTSDTNTHRPIKCKGTQILGDNTTALDFVEGTNITLSNSGGAITISASGGSNLQNFADGTGTGAVRENAISNNVASGDYSHAEGSETTSTGNYSHVEGYKTYTRSDAAGAHAEGNSCSAWQASCHAEGLLTQTFGDAAHAEGFHTETFGMASHAEGYYTSTSGQGAHAEGNSTCAYYIIASGKGSHAEGYSTSTSGKTIASGDGSHAEGTSTTASGQASHAEGYNTTASGTYSHAEGRSTKASNFESHAEGWSTTASGEVSHAEGMQTLSNNFESHAEGSATTASGQFSHAEGRLTKASGDSSHAEGYGTTAANNHSHAEGYSTCASGNTSHAEGANTTASGTYSHAEGESTIASGDYSHAEGANTSATNIRAHAEGYYTTASGYNSHAEGYQTLAQGNNSHAEGYSACQGYIVASGKGAHAEGHIDSTDTPTVASGLGSHAEGDSTTASGDYSHAEGYQTSASVKASHAEGSGTTTSGFYSHVEGYQTFASSNSAHAEGYQTKVSGNYSHAEGYQTTASGAYSHTEGFQTKATGNANHAEGNKTTASGYYSHAEGSETKVSGNYSHAEGYKTTAYGGYSHAEGYGTYTSGEDSHAEGAYTTASGDLSHAEGYNSAAYSNYSHAQGYYGETDQSKYTYTTGTSSSRVSSGSEQFLAIGTTDSHDSSPMNDYMYDSAYNNAFSIDKTGSIFARGAMGIARGIIDGVLVANGPVITLEDGACYILFTNGRNKSTGAWRGAESYWIDATFHPVTGTGTSTTAQAVPHIKTIAYSGSAPCKLEAKTTSYTLNGTTRYHSAIGIGSSGTAFQVRWNLVKVLGSDSDFSCYT